MISHQYKWRQKQVQLIKFSHNHIHVTLLHNIFYMNYEKYVVISLHTHTSFEYMTKNIVTKQQRTQLPNMSLEGMINSVHA